MKFDLDLDLNKDTLMTGAIGVLILLVLYLHLTCDSAENFADVENPKEMRSYYYDPRTGEQVDGVGHVDDIFGSDAEPVPGSVPPAYYFLDDGAEGRNSIQHNLCSKSCCASQYPAPGELIEEDPFVCQNKDKYVPSRYMCNNVYQDSGCLCLKKDQAKFFQNRGGNR